MTKVDNFYSIRENDRKVHHNNNKCPEGKVIESYVRSSGSDNRSLCEECEKLNGAEPLIADPQEARYGFAASFIAAMRQATAGWRRPAAK